MEELAKTFTKNELQIKELSKKLKVLKDENKEIMPSLLSCMINENIDCIHVADHSIVIKTTKSYGTINKDYLQESLTSFCGSNQRVSMDTFAEKATEHILSNRDVTETQSIKLIKKK